MRSGLPKVLHNLAGRPLLEHVVNTARSISPDDIHVVVGHGSELVKDALSHQNNISWIEQAEQLGTGHAVQQAMPAIEDKNTILVLYGDVPLIRQDTLSKLLNVTDDNTLGLLTVELEDPSGYGRIVRSKDGKVTRIVEHKDASEDELKIGEINTGILAVKASHMHKWLDKLDNNNVQGEYYLTDIISMAVEDGLQIVTSSPQSEIEIMGVNDKQQLSVLEREFQRREAERLMKEGITLVDPNRFDLRGEVVAGSDVVIDINVILEGKIELGNRVHIGPNTIIKNARIGDDVVIQANCVIEDAVVGEKSRIG
ncbi:MAG: bifunctional UDP-N-acetylglucosamine diphosphorylase/glucosamine-1-phosphate N-acetyltransferase GlmU, partial [Gammaproteobacteria bacterium]|nr:bifunctional UDP-N-acetylglucosamine diphosphorylase/glucosamine-1-phosphate N-acetyltransferase GlmU [Gammaproteobacteria bacterium]